jgi:hypothetical protein
MTVDLERAVKDFARKISTQTGSRVTFTEEKVAVCVWSGARGIRNVAFYVSVEGDITDPAGEFLGSVFS